VTVLGFSLLGEALVQINRPDAEVRVAALLECHDLRVEFPTMEGIGRAVNGVDLEIDEHGSWASSVEWVPGSPYSRSAQSTWSASRTNRVGHGQVPR